MLFRSETPSKRELADKVSQFKRKQLMKKQSKGRFGGKLHRLGYDERIDLSYGPEFLYSG